MCWKMAAAEWFCDTTMLTAPVDVNGTCGDHYHEAVKTSESFVKPKKKCTILFPVQY